MNIQRLDHINLVVQDLPAMTAFYRKTLGLTVTKRVTIAGDWIDDTVGLQGVKADVVYLEPAGDPDGTRLELIRYHHPTADRAEGQGEPHRPGLRHLAFKVDDIEAAVARLHAANIQTLSDIQTVPDAQVTYAGGARKRLVYFRDPEGNLLEFCWYGCLEKRAPLSGRG